MKKETAIYPSHRKLLGTTLAAAIMAALSCLLVIVQPHGTFGLVIGIAGLIFFGGGFCILFIMLLKNFFRSKPTLLLTPDSLRIYVIRIGEISEKKIVLPTIPIINIYRMFHSRT